MIRHALRGRGSRNAKSVTEIALQRVTPCEGVGVEIHHQALIGHRLIVTPCEGVGVEIGLGDGLPPV